MHPEFETVIGLEVHAQLATESKIFCRCPAKPPQGISVADVGANTYTCPVCTGQPGALPVLNKKVVEFAIKAGLATGCRINTYSVFSRKNYFYPDLPKGYQISQYDLPICEFGKLDIGTKVVSIQRIHIEEDAGKNVHLNGYSLVNLNRACVPLIEIVSGPDMSSSEEAGAYMRALYSIITCIEVCDGNMQEGNFRCDANVSVRPIGQKEFGTRAEIKNVNSFKFVEKAIDYEVQRQIELIKSGGRVIQETRLYDSDKGITVSMRSKEEAHDYRYFPEPDIVPLFLEQAWIDHAKKTLPELPEQKKARFVADFGLSAYDAGVLTSSKEMSQFFEEALKILENKKADVKQSAKTLSNYLSGEVSRLLNENVLEIQNTKLKPSHLADLAELVNSQVISSTGAKTAVLEAWSTGQAISEIVDKKGLKQVSDLSALEPAIEQVIAANPAQAAEFRAGKEKLLGFFVGQVMKATGGKANPAMLQELVKKKLGNL